MCDSIHSAWGGIVPNDIAHRQICGCLNTKIRDIYLDTRTDMSYPATLDTVVRFRDTSSV